MTIAALVSFFVPIASLFGMEASLLMMFLCLYIDRFKQDRFRQTLGALFPLVRPEGVVFLGVEGLYLLMRAGCNVAALQRVIVRTLLLSLPLMIACAGNLWMFQEVFPHSVGNKVAQGSGGVWQTYRSFLKGLVLESLHFTPRIILVAVVVLGIAHSFRKRATEVWFFGLAVLLWQVGLVVSKAAYYTWYALPLYFALFVGVCLGAAAIEALIRDTFGEKPARILSCGTAAIFLLWARSNVLPATALAPEGRQAAQAKAAQFISQIHSGLPTRVAALEVGHFGNALDEERFSIYDLCGLTSKNKGFFQSGFYDQFFCHDRPEYLVINHFTEARPVRDVKVAKGDGFSLITHTAANYHKNVWPHHIGLVLDARFSEAYEFIESITSPGYPGGLSVFHLRNSFTCGQPALTVQGVEASREHDPSVSASKVIDGDVGTMWNAGDGRTQWLRFTFEDTKTIRTIHLYPNRDREYEFALRIRFINEQARVVRALESRVKVSDGDLLELVLDTPQTAKKVEVESVHGHNWVAWREVRFF